MSLIKKRLGNKRGFTLLEVLIVIVILGVIAGLAIPIYTAQVEKSRAVEALQALDGARASAVRYFQSQHNPATLVGYEGMTYANMDFNPGAVNTSGQAVHFDYPAPTDLTATTFTLTATRNTVDGGTADAAHTITIDQNGAIVKGSAYQ